MVIYLPSQSVDAEPILDELTPREIVRELDKHVVGQADAKRAVAIQFVSWKWHVKFWQPAASGKYSNTSLPITSVPTIGNTPKRFASYSILVS